MTRPAQPDRWPRREDVLTLAILKRHERYRIAAVLRSCAGSAYVALVGQMRSTDTGTWRTARTFNLAADELDDVIDALERAREMVR